MRTITTLLGVFNNEGKKLKANCKRDAQSLILGVVISNFLESTVRGIKSGVRLVSIYKPIILRVVLGS